MATWTDTEAHVARKAHVCDSCGETINAGDSYRRWRYFNDGASTIRMHPECLEMHISGAASVGECEFEFEPHAHERPTPAQEGQDS